MSLKSYILFKLDIQLKYFKIFLILINHWVILDSHLKLYPIIQNHFQINSFEFKIFWKKKK